MMDTILKDPSGGNADRIEYGMEKSQYVKVEGNTSPPVLLVRLRSWSFSLNHKVIQVHGIQMAGKTSCAGSTEAMHLG